MKIHLIYPRGLRLVVFTITSNPRGRATVVLVTWCGNR